MTQQIFQAIIAQTAKLIHAKELEIKSLKVKAKEWNEKGEKAFAVASYAKASKGRTKLANLVALQVRTITELKAIYRKDRIAKKFAIVFGHPVTPLLTTAVEQEAMLDRLIAEKTAAEVPANVYE